MKKILTISASKRPKSNSSLLLSLCAEYINKKEPTQVKHINLHDYNIEVCSGCMMCAIKNEFCKISDDLSSLIDEILACDILIFAAPTYFLGAPSIVKALNDRLLYLHNMIDFKKEKHAGIIVTSGRKNWEGNTIQDMSKLLLSLGFKIKDASQFYAQGPSEVLLDDDLKDKMMSFVENLLKSDFKQTGLSDKCPICFGKSFEILANNRVRCGNCDLYGTINTNNSDKTLILFSEDDINNCRWTEQNLKNHMINWVEASGLRYKSKIRDIMKLRKQYNL